MDQCRVAINDITFPRFIHLKTNEGLHSYHAGTPPCIFVSLRLQRGAWTAVVLGPGLLFHPDLLCLSSASWPCPPCRATTYIHTKHGAHHYNCQLHFTITNVTIKYHLHGHNSDSACLNPFTTDNAYITSLLINLLLSRQPLVSSHFSMNESAYIDLKLV